jgi:hypothetical protein
LRRVAAAENVAENREPYRVFPFPHAPPFVPTRFADDSEPLEDRVSAVYRTVFGTPPDRETGAFLTRRLREWNGDMRRMSNLVSTMHTMASAESLKREEARDRVVKNIVGSLDGVSTDPGFQVSKTPRIPGGVPKPLGEKQAHTITTLLDTSESKSDYTDLQGDAGTLITGAAVSEVAGISSKLMTYLEADGIEGDNAEMDITRALEDWRDAQIAIAGDKADPRSNTDIYLDSRDLGTLTTSRQFEHPLVGL